MYRIFLYLVIDNVKVARKEVDSHIERMQFPLIVCTSFAPSTRIELLTEAEMAA